MSPSYFSFTGTSGNLTPDPPVNQTLTVSNIGSATLNYRAQTDKDWCTIDGIDNAGSIGPIAVSAGSSDPATVSVDPPSSIGSFTCTITVTDPSATNSPQTVSVVYVVNASTAMIQGFKVKVGDPVWPPPSTGVPFNSRITASGGAFLTAAGPSSIANPYFLPVSAGNSTISYTVTAEVPAGWSVSKTMSIDGGPNIYSNEPGNTAVVTMPAGSGHYADLWWFYTPPPPATIQGFKVKVGDWPPLSSGVPFDSLISITGGPNSGLSRSENAYFFSSAVNSGATHTVTATVPAGWSVSKTMSIDGGPNIYSNEPGNTAVVTMPAGSGHYADLWWFYTPPVPNPPSAVTLANPCGTQITVNWQDNSSNEDGFYVYRNKPGKYGSTSLSDYDRIYTSTPNVTSYTDNPAENQSYSYAVSAFNAGGESAPVFSGSVYNAPCAANLFLSSKTIYQYRTAPTAPWTDYDDGNSATPLPTLRNGYDVRFRITLSNTGSATGFSITLTDTFTNTLDYLSGSATFSAGTITVSGAEPNLIFTLNPDDKPTGSPNWVVTFDGRLTSASAQAIDFFRNTAIIRYQDPAGTPKPPISISTPLTPFRTGIGRVPTIREVAP